MVGQRAEGGELDTTVVLDPPPPSSREQVAGRRRCGAGQKRGLLKLLYDHFAKILREISPQRRYLLALSGGLDSCVLLHLLKRFSEEEPQTEIRVIHIHHGLSPNADNWQQFCEKLAQENALPFIAEKVQLDFHSKKGLEAEARSKRYRVFTKNLRENELLLTAHNQNDQAETVLLQLFRGAGAKGLSAMPAKKLLNGHEHLRPLLNFSRESLQEYATQHHLKWVEDESNLDQRFDRNFLRQAIFPSLKMRWPSANAQLMNAARSFSESAELLENLADLDLASALTEFSNQLDIAPLLALSALRQKNALRRFFQLNQAFMPDRKRLSQIMETIFVAKPDKNPCVQWKTHELHRFKGRLFLIPSPADFDSKLILPWNFEGPLKLPANIGVLNVEKKINGGLRCDLDLQKISIHFRRGGECIRWHQQTQALKKLFQLWKIPPWERDRVPLVFYKDELICVPGYALADDYQVKKENLGYFLYLN